MAPYNLFIIALTAIISIGAFNNGSLYNKLILWPKGMNDPKEYYRLLTSGFIHADWNHLIFNMLTLFFFGNGVEAIFSSIGSPLLFVILYLTAIIISSLPSFIKNRNNSYYRSLGASGGVAAVLFTMVYYNPWDKLYVMFIPMPSIVFGVLYLVYSAYMSKKNIDNINHGAHLWGAIYGLVYAFAFDPGHGQTFIYHLLNPAF